eukprot:1350151-Amorphochlora_amoeboformis.AAC.1
MHCQAIRPIVLRAIRVSERDLKRISTKSPVSTTNLRYYRVGPHSMASTPSRLVVLSLLCAGLFLVCLTLQSPMIASSSRGTQVIRRLVRPMIPAMMPRSSPIGSRGGLRAFCDAVGSKDKPERRKRVLSGVQPTGTIHLGNYLGAIKQWVDNQDKYENFFCVVDLHAITVPHVPKELKESIIKTAGLYIACGIDPSKSKIFVQSHVSAHA